MIIQKEFQADMMFMYLCDIIEKMKNDNLKNNSKKDASLMISLSARQEKILLTVSNLTILHPEGVSLKTLAERLHLTFPATSILVESMVQNGTFLRENCPHDRRTVCIKLSAAGQRIYQSLCNCMNKNVLDAFSDISDEDKEVFERIVTSVHHKIFFPQEQFRLTDEIVNEG